MNINFNSGYNNFQYEKYKQSIVEENKKVENSGQNVKTASEVGETVPDRGFFTQSSTYIDSEGKKHTIIEIVTYPDSSGEDPNNHVVSVSDVLKLLSMNYHIR